METAGTGTHVHNSALYHRRGDLTGSRREGSYRVTNSTCRAAAVSCVNKATELSLSLSIYLSLRVCCAGQCPLGCTCINTHTQQASSSRPAVVLWKSQVHSLLLLPKRSGDVMKGTHTLSIAFWVISPVSVLRFPIKKITEFTVRFDVSQISRNKAQCASYLQL